MRCRRVAGPRGRGREGSVRLRQLATDCIITAPCVPGVPCLSATKTRSATPTWCATWPAVMAVNPRRSRSSGSTSRPLHLRHGERHRGLRHETYAAAAPAGRRSTRMTRGSARCRGCWPSTRHGADRRGRPCLGCNVLPAAQARQLEQAASPPGTSWARLPTTDDATRHALGFPIYVHRTGARAVLCPECPGRVTGADA